MVLNFLHPAFLLVLSALVTCARGREGRGESCMLGQQRYKMGETWHPTLAPLGKRECINCTCHEKGRVECVTIKCPKPDCPVPTVPPGECCPVCDVGKEGPRESEGERPGCQYDGKLFKDGDLFPSNMTGLKPTRSDQCVMCHCAVGTVLCHLKTCLPTKCQKFKSVPDDCCPQCADKSTLTDDFATYVVSDPTQDNSTEADCRSPMGLHKNGSSWRPIVGDEYEVQCVVCTCLNGTSSCKRLECPDKSSLPCKRPQKRRGSCCKVCPPNHRRDRHRQVDSNQGQEPQKAGHSSTDGKRKGKGERSRKKKGPGSSNKRKKGKKRKKNRKRKGKKDKRQKHPRCKASDQEEVHPERKANVTSVAAIFAELCLPRRMDRIVYRVKGSNYDLLAFDPMTGPEVQVLRWEVEKGKSQAVVQSVVKSSEFRQTVTCAQIIGATNERGFKKLQRKAQSKTRRCKSKKRRCVTKGLDKVFKRDRRLKPLPTRRVCGQ